MIIYRRSSYQPATPPWLDGYQPSEGSPLSVCHRGSTLGHLVGIGDPLIFDAPPSEIFAEIDEEWSALRRGDTEPRQLVRVQRWAQTRPVVALDGAVWTAPVILTSEGERAFLVSYGGPDFLPVLTAEQQRCEDVARAAREVLLGGGAVDMSVACRWAAVLLSATEHLVPAVFAALGLLDDSLVLGTLAVATSLPLKIDREEPAQECPT